MEIVKRLDGNTIYKKRSGRFCIQNNKKEWIKGDEKVKILSGLKLIKLNPVKKAAPAEEKPAEDTPEATEAKPEEAKEETKTEA